jgi:CubicO group peptidase (beta-lactamase class C family)
MRRVPVLIVALSLIPIPLVRAGDPDAAKLAEIRTRMQKFVDDGEIAGAVTLVGRRSGVISHEAVGMLNIEAKQPMAKDALFRIASMTKPITAVGIMMLVDEGKLEIDDPVEKHLPEFKGQMLVEKREGDTVVLRKPRRPITLKDLLTHTSGLPAMPPASLGLYTKRDHTLAEVTMVMSQRPLEFEPGTKWSYCNAGIDTLGRIIEVTSGMPYEQFLQKRLFDTLGMKDTTFYPTSEQLARLAMTYNKKNGKLVAEPNSLLGPPKGAKHPIPAGGLYSTAADLAVFYQMMLNNGVRGTTRFLSENAVRTMTSNQIGDLKGAFTPGMCFGLGFAVVREPQGVTAMLSPGAYGHGGAFGTQGWLDPTQDLFVVLLIQRTGLSNGDASPMRQALQEVAVNAIK